MPLHSAIKVVFIVSLQCMSCCGETNEVDVQCIPFSMPSMRLRDELNAQPARPEQVLSREPTSTTSVGNISLDTVLSDGELHSHVVRSDIFYLTQTKAFPDDGVDRFVATIFKPEVFQIGKASVSSPFATAIKRKNPLCLLSGLGTDSGLLTYVLLRVSW